jgi:hypothetical protein
LDFAYGIRDRQIYHGRWRTDYTRPYTRDPQQSARFRLDYSAEYGRTDRQLAANRMDGGMDVELDLNRRFFFNDEARVGYDVIRKIDLRYELGPGLGYHLLQRPTLKANTSLGINYQEQYEYNGQENKAFYLRLAGDFLWQITPRLSLSEQADFFPAVADVEQFRARLELNLRYKLLQNLSLNLTVQDFYDTQPAADVNRNELKIRSSLGVTF